MMLPYKKDVFSITSDNDSEFYEHKMIAKKLNAEYFLHIRIHLGKED